LKPDSTDEIWKPSHPLYSQSTASYLGREPAISCRGEKLCQASCSNWGLEHHRSCSNRGLEHHRSCSNRGLEHHREAERLKPMSCCLMIERASSLVESATTTREATATGV